jgi:hypothetical protein
MLSNVKLELNKPLIVLYGEIRQGKTSVLNSVKWVFGGTFPTDIIRQGETEASIRLDLDDGAITRSFYVAKDGSTKARPVIFERNGTPVKDPVAEIKKLLNPFLLDQNHLVNMTELERKKYFAGLFSVDLSGVDKEIADTESKAVQTRAKLKAYGDIDLTPVTQPPDIASLQATRKVAIHAHRVHQETASATRAERLAAYATEQRGVNIKNSEIRENNFQVNVAINEARALHSQVAQLKVSLSETQARLDAKTTWLKDREILTEAPNPAAPDTSEFDAVLTKQPDTEEIDTALRQAEADKVRFEQYQKNQERQAAREQDEALILSLDATARELRARKIAKLQELSNATGIPGLAFDEAGNFSFEGSNAGMLSTSQLMRLSELLSGLYPAGFGLDLIDRAESLGKSIFDFIDRAKAENKTILAAVVGEQPANVPDEVGVFVVENGKVS